MLSYISSKGNDSLVDDYIGETIDYIVDLQERIDKAIDKIEAIKLNAKKYGADHDVLIYDGLLDILKGCDSNE